MNVGSQPEAVRVRLDQAYRLILQNPYIPHVPHPRQLVFITDPRPEVLFGGAAGGGKSDALLMAALMYVQQPGYSAIIFRRQFTDLSLPGGLIPRAHEWLDATDARWDPTLKQWTFPNGATLVFAYLKTATDHTRYQGANFHFVGFDELTQFEEFQYTYLFSRMRRSEDDQIPTRMRSTANPGGVGHLWVRNRFLVRERGRWGPREDPSVRFIPSKLEDNPSIALENYDENLRKLDAVTYGRLRWGNWEDIGAGELFNRAMFHIEAAPVVPIDSQRVRFWDLAATEGGGNYTVGLLMARTPRGQIVIEGVERGQWGIGRVRRSVAETAERDGRYTRVRMARDPGQAGIDQEQYYKAHVLPSYDYRALILSGSKWNRALPFAAQVANGMVTLRAGEWVDDYLYELEAFTEDPKGYAYDDQVDASSGGYHVFVAEPAGVFDGGAAEDLTRVPDQFTEAMRRERPRWADLRGRIYGD